MRHSDIAYVVVLVRVHDDDCLLLHRHRKWGDWSLVGGHVEAGEQDDWSLTAAREADEELPWQRGVDFEIDAQVLAVGWGPVPSRSAGGEPTVYRAQYFLLRFVDNPRQRLIALPAADFRLVPIASLQGDASLATPVARLVDRIVAAPDAVPLSWPVDPSPATG